MWSIVIKTGLAGLVMLVSGSPEPGIDQPKIPPEGTTFSFAVTVSRPDQVVHGEEQVTYAATSPRVVVVAEISLTPASPMGNAHTTTEYDPRDPVLGWIQTVTVHGPLTSTTTRESIGDDTVFPIRSGRKLVFRSRTRYTSTIYGAAGKPHDPVEGTRSCEIGSREPLTVPAGSFDIYPIECRSGNSTGITVERIAYAPSLGVAVRRETIIHWTTAPDPNPVASAAQVDSTTVMELVRIGGPSSH